MLYIGQALDTTNKDSYKIGITSFVNKKKRETTNSTGNS